MPKKDAPEDDGRMQTIDSHLYPDPYRKELKKDAEKRKAKTEETPKEKDKEKLEEHLLKKRPTF